MMGKVISVNRVANLRPTPPVRFEPGRAPSFLSPWCPPGAADTKNIHWTNMLLFSITPLICRYFLLMGIVKNFKIDFPAFRRYPQI